MNYYTILNVRRDATEEEIRKAYHKAALITHPDRNLHSSKTAEEEFKKISIAYGVLSDKEKRAQYDAYLANLASQLNRNFKDSINISGNNKQEEPKEDLTRSDDLLNILAQTALNYVNIQEPPCILGKKLAKAAKEDNWEKVADLFNRGASLNELCDKGYSALHYSVVRGYSIHTELLPVIGANVNTRSKSGNTALHYASDKGDMESCIILVNNGADLHIQNYNDQSTPLHIALNRGHINVACFLANHPTKLLSPFEITSHDIQDRYLNTPLHIALNKGYYEVADILLKQEARIDIVNKEGYKASDYYHRLQNRSTKILLMRNMALRDNISCITM